MRVLAGIVGIMLAVTTALADDADLLNKATLDALDIATASLALEPKTAPVKRIGVATIEGDTTNMTALLKSALTKTHFDVVLTSDADWGPLLDEFARQVKREDIMLKETAHDLRVQGVDAVFFGAVEKAQVEDIVETDREGRQATVRALLNLASLAEENPGSLLWSEQVTGMAEEVRPPTMDTRFWVFVSNNRVLLTVLGVLVCALLLAALYRRLTRPM